VVFYINTTALGQQRTPSLISTAGGVSAWSSTSTQQHWGQQRTPSLISTVGGVLVRFSSSTSLGTAANPLAHLHRRRHSGMVFYINSTRGSGKLPPLSPPPTVFRHGSLHRQQRSDTSPPRPSPLPMASRRFHQHRRHEEWYLTSSPISTADGFSALSSTLTPRGAIPHLLAGLHRRWLPGAFINIDATRSGASPPRPSTPPTASRRFHQH